MKHIRGSKFWAVLLTALLVLLSAMPAAAQGTTPPAPVRITRPAPALPVLETAEFIEALEAYRAEDTSTCWSQPYEFMTALEEVLPQVQHETIDGVRAYRIKNPGPGGVGVLIADLDGKTATLAGKVLYRDADDNDKLVAVWCNEDNCVYLVYDAITLPAGVAGFMIRLSDPLSPATDFSFWGDPAQPQNCAAGVARAQQRQGMPGGITVTNPITVTSSGITTTVAITSPLSVTQFHTAMATATAAGVDWLDVANFISEMGGGAYRITNIDGPYNITAGSCVVAWGSMPRDARATQLMTGSGWRAQMWCALATDLSANLPSDHGGVLLMQDTP